MSDKQLQAAGVDGALKAALDHVARTETLAVICDFDGTLAGFSTDPANVPVEQGSLDALHRLVRMPHTQVAILSGRHLEGLRQAGGFDDTFILAGSHGAEDTLGTCEELSPEQEATLDAVAEAFEKIAAQAEGAFVEYKPFQRVLHYKKVADSQLGASLHAQAEAISIPGVFLTPGRWIVEASAHATNKGTWITQARERLHATKVVFVGDDTTDEDGFRALGEGDVSIKVGAGVTAASYRVPDTRAVAAVLDYLAFRRTS